MCIIIERKERTFQICSGDNILRVRMGEACIQFQEKKKKKKKAAIQL